MAWSARRKVARALPSSIGVLEPAVATSDVTPGRARLLLATLLLEAGETERAEPLYRELQHEEPLNGDVQAGLGSIALARGDRAGARSRWARALELGVSDDALCYHYAIVAQNAGVAAEELRPVLERAVAIRPGFDDARYSLALLEKNAGHFAVAVEQLRAMREVAPRRAFAYWSAMSDALDSLERHEEAEEAARMAGLHAGSSEEKARAEELAYMARTEIAVQVAHEAGDVRGW